MKILSSIFILLTFMFSQELCEGTCLSEEETKSLFHNINEAEFELELCDSINILFESQLKDYEILVGKTDIIITEYELQLELKDKIIKEVTPKWWENKWLMIGLGFYIGSKF